jgi:small-conductance mechanosensitive channel
MREFFSTPLIHFKDHEITVFHVVIVLVVLLLTALLGAAVKILLRRQERRGRVDKGQAYSIVKISQYFMWTIAIVIILQTLSVNLTILVAGSAALLVGLGLGINQIFGDIISGFVILFEGIVKVGDVVEVSGKVARVEKIKLRTTQVRGRDNIAIIIPNSKFVNEDVINWSHIREKTRFDIKVGVSYDSDIELVKRLISEAAVENPNVSKNHEPQVRLLDYGDSALIFQLMFWGENEFRVEGVKSEIRYAILDKFRHHGVQIPFPQRVVHFEPASSSAVKK